VAYSFTNCIFLRDDESESINVDLHNAAQAHFVNCSFQGNALIKGSEGHGMVVFNKCIGIDSGLESKVILEGRYVQVQIKNSQFDRLLVESNINRFRIIKSSLSLVSVVKNSVIENLEIFGGSVSSILSLYCQDIKNLFIHGTSLNPEEQKAFKIKCLELTSRHEDESYVIKDFDTNKFSIYNLNRAGLSHRISNIRFVNLGEQPSFNVGQSNLVGYNFDRIDFSDVLFDVNDSMLLPATFVNIIWNFDSNSWRTTFLMDTEEKYKFLELQNTFSQLRTNYEKQGNRIVVLEFRRLEMEMQKRINQCRKKDRKRWDKMQDWIIINFLGYAIDNFGQNLFRPLVLLLAVHGVLFGFFLWEENAHFDFSYYSATVNLYKGAKLYLYTLNPVHKMDYARFGVANFLMRLFSALFIYHIIKVSRKYMIK
jgi:hypothetical protein